MGPYRNKVMSLKSCMCTNSKWAADYLSAKPWRIKVGKKGIKLHTQWGSWGEVGFPGPTVARIALALPSFPLAASVSYSLPSLLRCARSRPPSHLSLRAYAAWASCSHFIFSSVTRRGINHVFRGGHSAIYLSDTSSIQRPVAGHSPLSSKITHYFAPLLLPALSID